MWAIHIRLAFIVDAGKSRVTPLDIVSLLVASITVLSFQVSPAVISQLFRKTVLPWIRALFTAEEIVVMSAVLIFTPLILSSLSEHKPLFMVSADLSLSPFIVRFPAELIALSAALMAQLPTMTTVASSAKCMPLLLIVEKLNPSFSTRVFASYPSPSMPYHFQVSASIIES